MRNYRRYVEVYWDWKGKIVQAVSVDLLNNRIVVVEKGSTLRYTITVKAQELKKLTPLQEALYT